MEFKDGPEDVSGAAIDDCCLVEDVHLLILNLAILDHGHSHNILLDLIDISKLFFCETLANRLFIFCVFQSQLLYIKLEVPLVISDSKAIFKKPLKLILLHIPSLVEVAA